MHKKKFNKAIAIALSTLILSTPLYNYAYATENFNSEITNESSDAGYLGGLKDIENKPELLKDYDLNCDEIQRIEEERSSFNSDSNMSDVFSDEQVKLMKLEFQNTNGSEDKLITASNDNNVKVEVNGFRGIIKSTVYNNSGNVEQVSEVNYFESLDNLNAQYSNENGFIIENDNDSSLNLVDNLNDITYNQPVIRSAKSATTTIVPSKQFGTGKVSNVFHPSIKVTRNTRDVITINSTKSNERKTYSKEKYNWNSGSTLQYYNQIKTASSNWYGIANALNSAAIGKVIGYVAGLVAETSFAPQISAVVAVLGGIGIVGGSAVSIGYKVIKFLGSMEQIQRIYNRI